MGGGGPKADGEAGGLVDDGGAGVGGGVGGANADQFLREGEGWAYKWLELPLTP